MNRRPLKSILKWTIPIAMLAALAVGASLFLRSREQTKLRKAIAEREIRVERHDVKKVLYLTGKVLPSSSINIYSPVSGQITNILVKEGDRVKADQPLFSVKQDSTGQRELETRRNDVARAKLELGDAEENLTRIKSVGDLFSQTDRDKSEMDYQRKKLEHEAAVERLALLEESLGLRQASQIKSVQKTKSGLSTIFVTAPRDSYVTLISKSIGDAVLGTTSSNQVSESDVMTLSDVQQMIVRTKVLESDLELLTPGMPVVIRLDALKEKQYSGKLIRISQQGIDDKTGGFTYFMADVSLDDQDAKVRSQMNASLEIFVAQKPNVVSLPVDAVATSGKYSVVELPPKEDETLTPDLTPVYREVKIGLAGDDFVEILDGKVAEGETLLRIDYAKIDPKALAEGKINPDKKRRDKKFMRGSPGAGGARGGPHGG
jgi:RND family efflux transporter MFP subunit